MTSHGRHLLRHCARNKRLTLRLCGRQYHGESDVREPGHETIQRRPNNDRDQTADKVLHVPVMKDEVTTFFTEAGSKKILDLTFGAGGHSRALLEAIPDCHIVALDRDPLAYGIAQELAEKTSGRVIPLNGRFSDVPQLFSHHNIQPGDLDGVLVDTGASSMQFDQPNRGFSLSKDGPLDMRMDGNRVPSQATAADVVNSLDETDLAKILRKYGEETRAKKIAHGIVQARSAYGKICTTKELATVVENCAGYYQTDRLGRYSHPATRVFQALRIFVNNELNELNSAMEVAHRFLQVHGLCVAITFHSLEDRIVKRHFNNIDLDEEMNLSIRQKVKRHRTDFTADELKTIMTKKWEPVQRKVMLPTDDEIERNPRSRSAKMRVAVKCK